MREIGKRLVGMARRLAAIMKKYYDKELTYEFAAFASDRYPSDLLVRDIYSDLFAYLNLKHATGLFRASRLSTEAFSSLREILSLSYAERKTRRAFV